MGESRPHVVHIRSLDRPSRHRTTHCWTVLGLHRSLSLSTHASLPPLLACAAPARLTCATTWPAPPHFYSSRQQRCTLSPLSSAGASFFGSAPAMR